MLTVFRGIARSRYLSGRWIVLAGLAVLLTAGCGTRGQSPRDPADSADQRRASPPASPPPTISSKTSTSGETASETSTDAAESSIGKDRLWESPTAGRPLDLSYLPPGVQGIIAWRPAATYNSPQAAECVEAFARWTGEYLAEVEKRLGVPLREIDQLLIGLLDAELTDAGLGLPRLALVARRTQMFDLEAITKNPGTKQLRTRQGASYWEAGEIAWFLPEASGGNCLVVTPRSEITAVLELDGSPPPLRGELADLLRESDSERLLTAVFPSSFFSTGGKQMLVEELAIVRDALDWFWGRETLAAMASIDVREHLFLEVRLYAKSDVSAAQLERTINGRLSESLSRLDRHLAAGSPSEYGRKVLAQFPAMCRVAVDHTRTAHQGRQVIVRTCLPRIAASNLALGASLALSEIVPAGQVGTSTAAPPTQSIEERLRAVISMTAPRLTLEEAIESFGRETRIAVEILGNDLQLEGITKNQSFTLEAMDLPAGQVLEKILVLANPEGKLIYVVGANAQSGTLTLFVTTRAAAARRGDTIPKQGPERPREG